MPHPDSHFQRILPVVGNYLPQTSIAVFGLPQAAPIIEYLAACGVSRWAWDSPQPQLAATLIARHGSALNLRITPLPANLSDDPPHLIIAADPVQHPTAWRTAADLCRPALLIAPPTADDPGWTTCFFPGDNPALLPTRIGQSQKIAPTIAPLIAGLARAMLLKETPYARTDLADLWAAGIRVLRFPHPADPLTPAWLAPTNPLPPTPPIPFCSPTRRQGSLLIAGLGSLGSVAAVHLADYLQTAILVDPDRVEVYNPVRQAYPVAAIGQYKTESLAETLTAAGVPSVIPLTTALTTEAEVNALLDRHSLTAALIVTGTTADFAIARALQHRGIPHVTGRCYPRARYWEAIIVTDQTPSLTEMRGHVATGPAASPTPEQIAAYSDAGTLEAEPATLIESGWAAVWLAGLIAQLLTSPGLREAWFLRLLAARQTCLIGGVGVEPTPYGPAYHIAHPGQVRAWSRADLNLP